MHDNKKWDPINGDAGDAEIGAPEPEAAMADDEFDDSEAFAALIAAIAEEKDDDTAVSYLDPNEYAGRRPS